jgi:hypothetical protein
VTSSELGPYHVAPDACPDDTGKALSVSEVASDPFHDPSYDLYTLYNEKTAEIDEPMIKTWMDNTQNLMVLVRCTSSF